MNTVTQMKRMLDHRANQIDEAEAAGEPWRFMIKLEGGGVAYMMICPPGNVPANVVSGDFSV